MIKSTLKIETYFEYLLPGMVFVGGIWYLYRPYISKYFPIISLDEVYAGEGASVLAIKFVILMAISLAVGLVLKHLADIVLVAIVEDGSESEKASRINRVIFRMLFRLFTLKPIHDPRVHAMARYLESERKALFLKMTERWADSDESKMRSEAEKILVHQHIYAHLRVMSDSSKLLIDELYTDVKYAGTLLLSIALLSMFSLINIIIKYLQDLEIVLPMVLLIFSWLSGVIIAYAVKRRFRYLCSQVLILGLHMFIIENENKTNT